LADLVVDALNCMSVTAAINQLLGLGCLWGAAGGAA
jgi:hypothetical protein